jgi:serine acetyltransferase
VNKEGAIIGAGVVIVLVGTIGAIQNDKSPWPMVGAGIGLTALLSLLAATGEGPAKVATGLATVAALSVVFSQALPLFGLFGSLGKE